MCGSATRSNAKRLPSVWLALIFGLLLSGCSEDVPLDTPISLTSKAYIEQGIRTTGWRPYQIEFEFSRAAIPYGEEQMLIGAGHLCKGGAVCPEGLPIRVRWSLRSISGGPVALSGDLICRDAQGWSSATIERRVARFEVRPANYIFHIEASNDDPQLARIPTRVVIREIVKGQPFNFFGIDHAIPSAGLVD